MFFHWRGGGLCLVYREACFAWLSVGCEHRSDLGQAEFLGFASFVNKYEEHPGRGMTEALESP